MNHSLPTVFTVGHSTHSSDVFLSLLRRHDVTAVCDVRSSPFSRINPQFNREKLKVALQDVGIAYAFLGKELGARSSHAACYEFGKVRYDRLAQTAEFKEGLRRVREGLSRFRVALMCAEKEPLDCHRTILIARCLESEGVNVQHILSNGQLESHQSVMNRLLRNLKIPEHDMFRERAEIVDEAYKIQSEKIAYVDEKLLDQGR